MPYFTFASKCLRRRHIVMVWLIIYAVTGNAAQQFDIAIVGGRVVDPESGLDAVRNIGIVADKIEVITSEPITAKKVINASSLVVTPGFIDMHAHGQSILAGRVQALDGVTTALELEAGVLPVSAYYQQRKEEGRPINYGASVNWATARIATLLDIEPTNDPAWSDKIFSNTSWQSAISTPEQLQQIQQKVAVGLNEGALGVGFLSGYAPDSGYKEYFRISQLAAEREVPTFTHARFLSLIEPRSSFQGIEEIVAVAASTGVHAHIVHINSISLHDIDIISELVNGAKSRGVNLSTEAYPYGAGSTGVGAAMFKGDDWRDQIGGASAHNFELNGKRLSEEQFAYLQQHKPETEIVIHFLDMANQRDKSALELAVLALDGAIASDGGEWLEDGQRVNPTAWPLPVSAKSHPRSAGTFSRFLRLYVREQKALTLSQAIAKTSLIPAQILQHAVPQMRSKGRIQVGADADIVVFDLAEVTDQATYENPAQPSKGFHYVLVNGVPLVEEQRLITSVLPGQAIRRPITKSSPQNPETRDAR